MTDDGDSELLVRRFERGDGPRVRALHERALREAGAYVEDEGWDADLDAIPETYLATGGEFLVGEFEGRIVAMGGLRRVDEGTAEVVRMRVASAHQRRGFGRRLLRDLERAAADRGYARLVLSTTVGQTAARSLYRSAEYEAVGRAEEHGYEVVRYEKRLD